MIKTFSTVSILIVLLLVIALPGRGYALQISPLPSLEEIVRQGDRMYRDGRLASGEEIQAVIKGDVHVPGSAFSCVSCHLRSGIGSIEGQVLSPPTNGLKLYKPYYQYNPVIPDPTKPRKSMMDNPAAKPLYRPAYTDATLAEAIRSGVNPVGRRFNDIMPRYLLEDRDMAILIAYLKTLSAEPSPGVTEQQIRFATVVAGDVPTGQRTEMFAMLDAVVEDHNRKAKLKNRYLNYGDQVKAASFNYPLFALSRWELTGPPATWRGQLDEYYRKEPVFALLGGLSAADWQPVHEFSEQNKIPCLLPVTDFPVISDRDVYTLYFSKGAYQEGETAARYFARSSDLAGVRPVLQIVDDSARARAVAVGFQEAWKESGRRPPLTIQLSPGERITADTILRLVDKEKPAAIMLWTAEGTVAALGGLGGRIAPDVKIHLAATLLGEKVMEIPEAARSFTYISYPYRIGEGNDQYHVSTRAWMQKRKIPVSSSRISTRLFSLTKVLLEPFQIVKRDFNPAGRGNGQVIMEEQSEMMMHVKRNYYRDYLFDVIGMMADTNSVDYERISFGPGQRYVSKGCYIVQLSPGQIPDLIKRSDWVIY
jgi:hypothetical protein